MASIALALGAVTAAADDVSNSLDASVDAVAELMPLNAGGANGTTQFYVKPANGDGKNGCNFGGTPGTLVLSVASSNPSVATVSPSSITLSTCDATGQAISVTPVGQGSAAISVSETSNTTGASFSLAAATFTVTVAPPANTAPTIEVSGVTAGATYDKGSVPAATCKVTDAEDGNSTFPATLSSVTGGSYTTDGIGNQTAGCSYTDKGGLTASASATYAIADPTAPVVDKTITGTLGENGWYTSDVTLEWNVSDPQSTVSLVSGQCIDQNITADQEAVTYSCSAFSAGGTSGPVNVSIKRDATAPAVGCDPAPTGWSPSNVSIACTASDATSRLAVPGDASFSLTTSVNAGTETSSASTGSKSVKDNAGQTSVAGPYTGLKVDRKAPVIGCSAAPTFTLGESGATVAASATDGGSGPASQNLSAPASTAAIGSHSVTFSAQDDVGNSSTESCGYSVVYDWDGFFQPIDNGGVLNKAKAGSTIPVKFSLGGNQGLGIMAEGSPSSAPIACQTTLGDAVEETTNATSGLKYDAIADQYIYNWKTASSFSGTCRRLTVKLIDGTSHTALFHFVK